MEAAARSTSVVLVTALNTAEQNVARQLFFMLAMVTKGPALAIVRQAEISGGGPNGARSLATPGTTLRTGSCDTYVGLITADPEPNAFPRERDWIRGGSEQVGVDDLSLGIFCERCLE